MCLTQWGGFLCLWHVERGASQPQVAIKEQLLWKELEAFISAIKTSLDKPPAEPLLGTATPTRNQPKRRVKRLAASFPEYPSDSRPSL